MTNREEFNQFLTHLVAQPRTVEILVTHKLHIDTDPQLLQDHHWHELQFLVDTPQIRVCVCLDIYLPPKPTPLVQMNFPQNFRELKNKSIQVAADVYSVAFQFYYEVAEYLATSSS